MPSFAVCQLQRSLKLACIFSKSRIRFFHSCPTLRSKCLHCPSFFTLGLLPYYPTSRTSYPPTAQKTQGIKQNTNRKPLIFILKAATPNATFQVTSRANEMMQQVGLTEKYRTRAGPGLKHAAGNITRRKTVVAKRKIEMKS